MWTYKIALGQMIGPQGEVFPGYSGAGYTEADGRNNPEMVADPDKGPIPPGCYTIMPPENDPRTGPYSMHLEPTLTTNTFGRSAFLIHGNNAANDASHGCIILPPDARHDIWASGDHDLTVMP